MASSNPPYIPVLVVPLVYVSGATLLTLASKLELDADWGILLSLLLFSCTPLAIYHVSKHKNRFVACHAAEAFNLNFTYTLFFIGGLVLFWAIEFFSIGPIAFVLPELFEVLVIPLYLFLVLFGIVASIRGRQFRYGGAIRLLKPKADVLQT
jgi:uncharacterized Tic20 family protein